MSKSLAAEGYFARGAFILELSIKLIYNNICWAHFFEAWTLKETSGKCEGTGMAGMAVEIPDTIERIVKNGAVIRMI